jgi:predicted TIM-barrel fold metal-dependent hydrolase
MAEGHEMATVDAHQHFWWIEKRPHSWPESFGTLMDREPAMVEKRWQECGFTQL